MWERQFNAIAWLDVSLKLAKDSYAKVQDHGSGRLEANKVLQWMSPIKGVLLDDINRSVCVIDSICVMNPRGDAQFTFPCFYPAQFLDLDTRWWCLSPKGIQGPSSLSANSPQKKIKEPRDIDHRIKFHLVLFIARHPSLERSSAVDLWNEESGANHSW